MRPYVRGALSALLAAGIMLAVSSVAARAQTTGSEQIDGHLSVSFVSGTREVVGSVVRARGVFNGVGQDVEIQNLPGDPDNVNRDDLVFSAGILHLRNVQEEVSFTLDPRSCLESFRAQGTSTVEGGTRLFIGATGSFAATVIGRGLARRNPDGSCAQDQAPRFEEDTLTLSGSLSF